MTPKDVQVILCTCSPGEAPGLARALLEERLVACVNIVPGLRSLYRWKDQLEDDEESLLIIKTPRRLYARLEERLNALHPADVPEILSLSVADGSDAYISWVYDATRS